MSYGIPEDLGSFWGETAGEAHAAPLDYHRSRAESTASHKVDRVQFRGIDGTARHGWIAYPEGAQRERSTIWVPPYGRESLLPNEYGTRQGMVSLSLNFFGHESFHQEKYTPARGYFAEGVEDPHHYVFRRMFQDAYLAVRVLQAQPEVDESRIGAMGMSQGGGISIWLGAFCPIVKAVAADMPFFGRLDWALSKTAYRYPLKEIIDAMETIPMGRERIMHTVSYFDTAHIASLCQVPTLVSLGEKDPAVRPEQAEAIFEAVPGVKTLLRYDWGHDWHPDMIKNNRDWLERFLPSSA